MFEIFDGDAERNGIGDIARSGLELSRRIAERRAIVLDFADHIAAREEGRHRFEQRALAVQHADARRPEHLVPAEGVEIGIERFDVERQVRCALSAVDEDDGPGRVGAGYDFLQRHDRPERIADVRDCDELAAVE